MPYLCHIYVVFVAIWALVDCDKCCLSRMLLLNEVNENQPDFSSILGEKTSIRPYAMFFKRLEEIVIVDASL